MTKNIRIAMKTYKSTLVMTYIFELKEHKNQHFRKALAYLAPMYSKL